MKSPYYSKFFENRTDSVESAKRIVPIMMQLVRPKSIVDVGCANGELLQVCREKGVRDVFGIDGPWVQKKNLRIPENLFMPADLEKPVRIGRTFDLVISMEVAEHLHEQAAKTFVDTLTGLGPVILFSAAIPLQSGANHLNEQWPEYWKKLFDRKGYVLVDCIRRRLWDDNDVTFWYAQNSFLYVRKDYLKKDKTLRKEFETSPPFPLTAIHPKIYLTYARLFRPLIKITPYRVKRVMVRLFKVRK